MLSWTLDTVNIEFTGVKPTNLNYHNWHIEKHIMSLVKILVIIIKETIKAFYFLTKSQNSLKI